MSKNPRAIRDADWEAIVDAITEEFDPTTIAKAKQQLAKNPAAAQLAASLTPVWRAPLPAKPRDLPAAWAAIQRKVAEQQATLASPPLALAPSKSHAPTQPLRSLLPWRLLKTPQLWAMAVLCALIVFHLSAYADEHTGQHAFHYYAALQKTRTVTLDDHSQVILARGALLVTDNFGSGTNHTHSRTVHLNGDATFVVHADPRHPFIVESYGVSTVAIGTHFTIARDSAGAGDDPSSGTTGVHVSVTAGKVLVQRQTLSGDRETIAVLGPGQETSVQTFMRHFRDGWAAGGAHKSIPQIYMEAREAKVEDSLRALHDSLATRHP